MPSTLPLNKQRWVPYRGSCPQAELEIIINYARASGWCDTASHWECDALFEFGQTLLLNALQRRMLDMGADACDLQARH